MVIDINNYDNISNDTIDDVYFECSFNCVMSISFLFLACFFCCVLGYYNKLRYIRQSGGLYADLYTQDIDDRVNLYSEPEYEDDKGLFIRGRNIYNQPPKYSEN